MFHVVGSIVYTVPRSRLWPSEDVQKSINCTLERSVMGGQIGCLRNVLYPYCKQSGFYARIRFRFDTH